MSTLKWQDYWPLKDLLSGHLPPHKTLPASTAPILTSCPGSADILLLTRMDSIAPAALTALHLITHSAGQTELVGDPTSPQWA